MSLSAPEPRRPIHTRRITFEGFLREDGLWDFDCELIDTKAMPIEMAEKGVLPAGSPVHHFRVRLTVDDSLTIRAAEAEPAATPFGICSQAANGPLQKLVGLTMGPGWRKAIEGAIGGVAGCTHLRELVFNAATAAFQTIPVYRERERRERGEPPLNGDKPPFFMGQCMTWSFSSPVVQQHAPQFYRAPQEAA